MSASLPNLTAGAGAVAAEPGRSTEAAAGDWLAGLQAAGLSPAELTELLAIGERLLGVSGAVAESISPRLRVALAAKPRGKLLLVTDAMPMVGADTPDFVLYGETIAAVKVPVSVKMRLGWDADTIEAAVVGAAILNGLKVAGKDPSKVKLVASGAGAAALACLGLLVKLGLPKENIWVTDLAGLVYEGRVFTVSSQGLAVCTDAKTGKDLWEDRLQGRFLPSPIVLGDKLLICNDPGQCYLVKASPEKFEVLGTNVLPELITSSPVVADGALFIRSAGALYKIAKK